MTSSGPSVLVVEDEGIVALDLQQTLTHMGYDAYAVAASADEALARASERRPDIVLMDIRIKGARDGVETAEILRDQHDIPVVYVTAHADDATLNRAKQTTPYGYVVKPVKAAELKSMIEICLHRHASEVRLRRHDRWLSTTLRSIPDGVLAVDARSQVTFMNPAAEALLGVTRATAEGRMSYDVLRGPLREPLDRALAQRTPAEAEAVVERLDEPPRLVEHCAAPVLDGDELLGAVIVMRDVTEPRRMRQQLELVDRLVSLGTLAAGVAHEINNPLAVVLASAEMAGSDLESAIGALRSAPVDTASATRSTEEAREAQAEIVTAAQQIRRIVADLRLFGRRSDDDDAITDVSRAIAWAVRTTRHEVRDRAHVVVDVEPGLHVSIDETRLGQVLINLIVNAAHAILPGHAAHNEIKVTASRNGSEALIEVSDTGVGMTREVMARMFEPFYSADRSGAGGGLGLSICHAIVRGAGGTIDAESTPGEGTTFRVRLRVAELLPDRLRPSPSSVPAAARARVLAIDDEPAVLHVLDRALSRDHALTCVSSAAEALARIDAGEEFDVILCDLAMPEMNGADLLEVLAARHPDLATRVVLITGGARDEGEARWLAARPHLDKPFKLDELRRRVSALVARTRRSS